MFLHTAGTRNPRADFLAGVAATRRDAVDEIQAISVALTINHYTPRRSNRLRLWMEEEEEDEEEEEEVFTSYLWKTAELLSVSSCMPIKR